MAHLARMNLLALLVPISFLMSQPGGGKADSTVARGLFERGKEFQKIADFRSAISIFDSAASLYAGAGDTDGSIRSIVESAVSWRQLGKFAEAIERLQMPADDETMLRDSFPLLAAHRLVTLGSLFVKQGKLDSALSIATMAEEIQAQSSTRDVNLKWDAWALLGSVWFELGNHDSAFAYNEKALQLFPSPSPEQRAKVSNSLNSIANIHQSRGDYRKALEYYLRSYEIHRLLVGDEHPEIAVMYNNIAIVHMLRGDYDLSLEYHLKSLSIALKTNEPDDPSFGVKYNNIAMAYRTKGDFRKALEFGNKSREVFEKKLGARHVNTGIAINNMGRTYSDMQRYDEALKSYRTALGIWEEKLGSNHPVVAQGYFNVGEALGNIGQSAESAFWLQRSLMTRIALFGESNAKVAQTYGTLARIYAEGLDVDSSLTFYQKSLASLVEGFASLDPAVNPDTLRSSSDLDLLAALSGKARTFQQRYRQKGMLKDLQASLNTAEKASLLVESLRRGFSAEGSKIQLAQTAFQVYEIGVTSARILFENTRDPIYLSAAFSLSERSKAGILWDAITEAQAVHFAGIPDSLVEQEGTIRIDLAHAETQLQKEKERGRRTSPSAIRRWESTLFDLRRTHDALIDRFEHTYPLYHSLKHQESIITIEGIQAELADNRTAVLEYFAGDTTLTIFAITRTNATMTAVGVPSPLAEMVTSFRRSIQNLDIKGYLDRASMLHEYLLKPVGRDLEGISKLLIVPDGILHYLPFDALLSERSAGTNPDFSRLAYVIEDFEISYLLSARIFQETRNREEEGTPVREGPLAGFAPVFADHPNHASTLYSASLASAGVSENSSPPVLRSVSGDDNALVELKESEQEVRSIFRLFEAGGRQAKIYLHDAASERELKSPAMKDFRYIHIATHGLINEERPKLSGIVFAKPTGTSRDDGILYSGEVYNLRLNADLLVLSACETGLGTVTKGEGILGLTRGFLYAGARNLVVSLWQVADKSTADLMVRFYDNILTGEPYPAALRNAKVSMIKAGRFAHPVEWSAFVLRGL